MCKCPYCRGKGYEPVESGSSLSAQCPDCGGSGVISECKKCGKTYEGEYCEDCFTVCEGCRKICSIEDDMDSDYPTLCDVCAYAVYKIIPQLAGIGLDPTPVSVEYLATIWNWAYDEALKHFKCISPEFDSRVLRSVSEIIRQPPYNCKLLEQLVCPRCGEYGVHVEEGEDENELTVYKVCTDCGCLSTDEKHYVGDALKEFH